ncbi:uncharacterized protein LOC107266864 isoform X3 [Cephus cinctus]|uniref:Uncharacterized protein LOC107266864 isoform X3 n=1 Tax=Cephus cinctus TaxID=211228 RepID=A0AAJ7BTE8_CEPCN|nr:uncharacterized protein LOC107266864 isoform X3 [Cephus cinctus]
MHSYCRNTQNYKDSLNAMGGAHLHTPQSIFQHMMGQQNAPQQVGPWLQVPQMPMSIPWSVAAVQQPDLVRFTGERQLSTYGPAMRQKRKLDTPDVADTRHTKQFITEEKMAAHFSELHISTSDCNHNPMPSTSSGSKPELSVDKSDTYADLDMDGSNSISLEQSNSIEPRLIISEELRRFRHEPILPNAILSKLERPSMALVLWEPPSKHLRILPTPRDTPTPIPTVSDDNNNRNNNGSSSSSNNNSESISDLNEALFAETSTIVLEPMDE